MKKLILALFVLLAPTICWGGVAFDGTDDYLCLEGQSGLLTAGQSITITAWIYPTTVAVSQGVFEYGSRAPGSQTGFLFKTMPTNNELILNLIGFVDITTTAMTISTTEEQFVAVSYENSSDDATFYHFLPSTNTWTKQLVASTFSYTAPTSSTDIIIGATHSWASSVCSSLESHFSGKINDVYMFGTNLSENQIHNIGKSKLKRIMSPPSNLVLYYPLDDEEDGSSADGDVFTDLSSNRKNFTGNDGANNTGLTAKAEAVLTYTP